MQTRLQAVVDQAPANRESGDSAGAPGSVSVSVEHRVSVDVEAEAETDN